MTKDTEILGLPENACVLLWKHFAIDVNGEMSPCCRFNIGQSDIPAPLIKDGAQSGFVQGEFFQSVRQAMLENKKLASCQKCWDSEKFSKENSSMRTSWNAQYAEKVISGELDKKSVTNPTLEYLELGFSSHCNLACRMCSSDYSSKWASIEKQYGVNKNNSESGFSIDIENFDIDLNHLEKIKLIGGEPLLAKEHDQFIQKLSETHQTLDRLEITYHTNGTILPSQKILDFWKKAGSIIIVLSIDAVGDRNNYLRPGQIGWDTIEHNTRYFLNLAKEHRNIKVTTHTVLSRLNILKLGELHDWIQDIGFCEETSKNSSRSSHGIDILISPKTMSIHSVPQKDREIAERYILDFQKQNTVFNPEHISRIIGALSEKSNNDIEKTQVAEEMKMLDDYFGTDFDNLEDTI